MSAESASPANLPFAYEINRSKRRTLAIHIRSGKVEVRAPLNAPSQWIETFVQEKSQWVGRKLGEQRRQMRQHLVIADNQPVCLFGQPRTLQVVLAPKSGVQISDSRLLLFTREHTPQRLEAIFHRWLQQQAREYMVPRSIRIARELEAEHRLQEVVFRKTRSKWGHCRRDGTIQYNPLVMMAPRAVVDYLVAHECSHLLHMDHSPRFWQTVGRVCPDYARLRGWLKHNGHRLWTA